MKCVALYYINIFPLPSSKTVSTVMIQQINLHISQYSFGVFGDIPALAHKVLFTKIGFSRAVEWSNDIVPHIKCYHELRAIATMRYVGTCAQPRTLQPKRESRNPCARFN